MLTGGAGVLPYSFLISGGLLDHGAAVPGVGGGRFLPAGADLLVGCVVYRLVDEFVLIRGGDALGAGMAARAGELLYALGGVGGGRGHVLGRPIVILVSRPLAPGALADVTGIVIDFPVSVHVLAGERNGGIQHGGGDGGAVAPQLVLRDTDGGFVSVVSADGAEGQGGQIAVNRRGFGADPNHDVGIGFCRLAGLEPGKVGGLIFRLLQGQHGGIVLDLQLDRGDALRSVQRDGHRDPFVAVKHRGGEEKGGLLHRSRDGQDGQEQDGEKEDTECFFDHTKHLARFC